MPLLVLPVLVNKDVCNNAVWRNVGVDACAVTVSRRHAKLSRGQGLKLAQLAAQNRNAD